MTRTGLAEMLLGALFVLSCGGSEFSSNGSGGGGAAGSSAGATGGSGAVAGSGAAAGSGAVAGSGGAGAVAGGGGVGGGTTEKCTNGVDDDGDGAVDCADEDCAPGFQCVPGPALDSVGPFYMKPRSPNDPSATCEEGLSSLSGPRLGELKPGAHDCLCTCGNPTGGSCGTASALVYTSPDCSVSSVSFGEGCNNFTNNAVGSIKGTVGVSTLGECASSVLEIKEPAGWGVEVDRCAVEQTGAGCSADELCVPRAPDSFVQSACVELSGNVNCPAAYPVRQVYYDGISDTRQCSGGACTCGAPTNRHCGGMVRFFESNDCPSGGAVRALAMDGQCQRTTLGTSFTGSMAVVPDQGPSGGRCDASGTVNRSGTVSPANPYTVCCADP